MRVGTVQRPRGGLTSRMKSKLVPIGRLWERLASSITRRPVLCAGMTLYWLWTNMTFQMPVVFEPSELFGIQLPSQVAMLVANICAYVLIVTLFAIRRFEFKGRIYLWTVCTSMSAGSALIGCWMLLGGPEIGNASETAGMPGAAATTLYLAGSVLAGAASAALCIEMQRVYGNIESESILFHGAVSYLVSIVIVFLLSTLPQVATFIVYALVPLPIARCLGLAQAELTQRELYGRGKSAGPGETTDATGTIGRKTRLPLKLPYKLLATSLLHGMSLGILAGSTLYLQGSGAYLTCAIVCYALSACLVLFAAFLARLNFNSLIYQVAFPIIALGLYALYAFDAIPTVGTSIQLVGFSFLHLVMWCVCSFLIKSFDVPPVWVIGTSTCAFMVGQLAGNVASCALVQLPGGMAYERLIVTMLLVMLGASLLMISNRNLRTGWGLAKPDNMHTTGRSVLNLVVSQVATEASLTEREASVLLLLGRGRNRQTISDELQISKETAKTHIQSIYRKVGVHSQQELLSLLERKGSAFEISMHDQYPTNATRLNTKSDLHHRFPLP